MKRERRIEEPAGMDTAEAPLIAALKPRLTHRRGRPRLKIAAAGHRDLPPATSAVIRETARRLLTHLEVLAAPADMRIVSSLAEGADRLISEAALAVGANLSAFLPFELHEFEQTFDLGDRRIARAEFRRLLSAAESETGGGVTIIAPEAGSDRDEAYRRCALRMVEDCDLMIAVLSVLQGSSHTAAGVRQALSLGIPVAQIEPEHPETWRLVLPGA